MKFNNIARYIFGIVSGILMFSTAYAASPTITFIDPTPANNSTVSGNSITIKTQTTGDTIALDWDKSLIGWWRFNNESGESNTSFKDWPTYANNATCSGISCPVLGLGKFGKALQFDGVNDYLKISDSSSLDIQNKFTISVWIKKTGDGVTIISKDGVGEDTAGTYNLYAMDDLSIVYATNKIDRLSTGESAISLNEWHYIAITFDNSVSPKTKIYIDGVEKASGNTTAPTPNSKPLLIGRRGTATYGLSKAFFNGYIDDARIYSRALSVSEIKSIYDAQANPLAVEFAGLSNGSYLFNAYAQDSTGAANAAGQRLITVSFPQSNALSVYVVPAITDNKILPDDMISAVYKSDAVAIQAAKGEYEPASFVIRSNHSIQSLSVEAANLIGPGGTISADNIDIKAVKVWWQAGNGLSDITHKQLKPELLLKDDSVVKLFGNDNYIKLSNGEEVKISDPGGITGIGDNPTNQEFPVKDSGGNALLPFILSENYNKQFWITVKIPDNAAAGIYSGKIYLKNSGKILKEINLKVKVLPFKLSESKLEYSIYGTGNLSSGEGYIYSPKTEAQYRAQLKDLVAHGITNPTVQDKTDKFGKHLSVRNQLGISNKVIYKGNSIDGLSQNQLAEYKKIADSAGVKSLYFYLPDEIDITKSVNLAQVKGAAALVHNIGAKVFDAQHIYQSAVLFADNGLDLLISKPFTPSQFSILAKKYHDSGKKVFSYGNPQLGQETPETYRRNYGLYLWQNDYDGAMGFAYMFGERSKNNPGLSNLWNDFDGLEYRDHNMVYPTVDGVIDTIQWEGFREGVDDIRYLSTLFDRVSYAQKKGINVANIENWISDLKSSNLSQKNLDSIRAQMVVYISGLPESVSDCIPDAVSGCMVCNANGAAWADNDSKCKVNEKCSNGVCVAKCTSVCAEDAARLSGLSSFPSVSSNSAPQMTRAEILQKINEIKRLLIESIMQLIAELQVQLDAVKK